jgi:phenylpropionate dioxygenase-like ring-hydroxylating dioxygenase large terminal subunit
MWLMVAILLSIVLPCAAVSSAVQPQRRRPLVAAREITAEPASVPVDTFDWLRSWYPVNVLSTMDPARSHPVQLLGISLVANNDGAVVDGVKQPGRWHVCEDLLPPRTEPRQDRRQPALLSPRLVHAPQVNAGGRSYPAREADGLLFVFPYNGVDAEAVAAAVPLPLIDELHDPALEGRWKWKIPAGVRDFPCSWDAMVENTLDPAHFCSAHHGTLGNRYTDPAPYEMRVTRSISKEAGFAVDGDLGRVEFVPPCLVKYVPNYSAMPFNGALVIATYCVPIKPGWVRPLANVLLDDQVGSEWDLSRI